MAFGAWSAPLFSEDVTASYDYDEVSIMPLSEVEAGMEGEWRTVIAGTEVQEFSLEVIGVAENFIGPGRSLIICHATDAENILSGPVSGMSGSPVYIDGKLVGAYAYGFTWPKEQAIIGVTPIEDMLEVFERFPPGEGERTASGPRRYPEWADGGSGAGAVASFDQPRPSAGTLQNYLKPLPTTLSVAGISPEVISHFREEFEKRGLEPAVAPMGRAGAEIDTDLRPGSAVAGVLLDGDFSIAGTGTVTYRDGDRILAFGHPFFGIGDTEIPMAAAEIMTVVRSVISSFKLSNTGPVVGTIYQDRLSAVAGEIGRKADVTALKVSVSGENGSAKQFQGNLFRHRQFTPLVSAMALAESLTQTLEAGAEQTFFITTRWEIEGHDPVVLRDVAAGPMAPIRLAARQMNLFDNVLNNPYSEPVVKSIDHEISFRNEWLLAELDSVYLDRSNPRPGETTGLTAVFRNYRGERTTEPIPVEIPSNLRRGEYTLYVGEASGATSRDPLAVGRMTSLGQLLDRIRRQRSRESLYVMLLQEAEGTAVEGQNMPDVLPSVQAVLGSSNNSPGRRLREKVIWEKTVDLEAEVVGSQTLTIEVQ